MGNRDALLDGARQCLERQGYATTTARDVAAVAGVSLAAIGYHFGTVDALLRQVIIDGMGVWGTELGTALADAPDDAAVWDGVMRSFAGHRGPLLASFELLAHAERDPDVRRFLDDAMSGARRGLTAVLDGPPGDDPARGAFHYALLSGLLVQWLVNPAALPDGAELAGAMGPRGRVPGAGRHRHAGP